MKLNALSKEQKQYLFLGMVVVAAMLAGIVFGIKVSLASISVAKMELQDLCAKIDSAQTTLKDHDVVTRNFTQSIAEMKVHVASSPPVKNYFSWAAELVYSQARAAGIDVDAIDELANTAPASVVADGENSDGDSEVKPVELESYSLRVAAHGSYEKLVELLKLLENRNPLVRITGVDMSTGKSPLKHDIQIFLQWPLIRGE
ncbi:MAG: hypothetical protein K9M45_03640 [Kiritimatiellales bacterium]|nr:hypothetical protein [Kiritimatiellales bacterium]